MKNCFSFSLILMFCYLFSYSSCNLKTNKQREDVIAEEYNFENKDTASKGAISYGLASNAGYVLPDEIVKAYIAPTFVKELPSKDKMEAPEPGPTEAVEEIPTTTDYYDGSTKLNTVQVKCTVFADPSECFKQSSCGWCGSSNTCVLGNNMGPLQSCVKSSYIFSPPIPNWNKRISGAESKPIEAKVGGMNLKVVNK